MQRNVRANLTFEASGDAKGFFAVGVASGYQATERFEITQGGKSLPFEVVPDLHGGRLHVARFAKGLVEAEYSATVEGIGSAEAVSELDEATYQRPSRYCESDSLMPTAIAHFGELQGEALVVAVGAWVRQELEYVPGSSLSTDGAVRTLLARRGVCRDYAHLVVSMLRALDVPARVASVYAPGLSPMDFHAVAEAAVDGTWRVVDATGHAPRDSMVRIASGRDAADIAFLSTHGDPIELLDLTVTAVVDSLPTDDPQALTVLQ